MNIKKLVYKCLDEQPHTRNNDLALYRAVIERGEDKLIGDSVTFELLEKYHLPSVIRHRAYIQNKENLCEAEPKVKIARARHAERKRKMFGLFPMWS